MLYVVVKRSDPHDYGINSDGSQVLYHDQWEQMEHELATEVATVHGGQVVAADRYFPEDYIDR